MLTVEFCGEIHQIKSDDTLTFGRDADLMIDTNPHLHRRLGVFHSTAGLWRLTNTGSAIRIEIADTASPARAILPPGATATLDHDSSLIRFQAGPSTYELEVDTPEGPESELPTSTEIGPATITPHNIGLELTDDQKRLILSLSWHQLHDPAVDTIPTNSQAAALLGWKATRFNRKVDYVCNRLTQLGVGGLHGDIASHASDRRRRLVAYAIDTRLVSDNDLHLVPGDTPRP